MIKPGFETLTVNQPIPAPWYQYTPIDFVSENLVTTKIRDNRTVNYNLAPQLIVPTQELIDRANQLRQDTLQYGATPVGATLPINTGPVPVGAPGPPVGAASGFRTGAAAGHQSAAGWSARISAAGSRTTAGRCATSTAAAVASPPPIVI